MYLLFIVMHYLHFDGMWLKVFKQYKDVKENIKLITITLNSHATVTNNFEY